MNNTNDTVGSEMSDADIREVVEMMALFGPGKMGALKERTKSLDNKGVLKLLLAFVTRIALHIGYAKKRGDVATAARLEVIYCSLRSKLKELGVWKVDPFDVKA